MKRTIDLIGIILLFLLLFGLLTIAAYSVGGQTPEVAAGSGHETPPPTGGQFTMQQAVVAGGGNPLQQGQLLVHAMAGQTAGGHRLNGGQFRVYSGFWTPDDLMPTAANVSVSGRVMTSNGQGIRNVLVTLTDRHGVAKRSLSGSFGYYNFDDVSVGETYVITATAKRYRFAPRAIAVFDQLADIDLIADE